MVVIQVDHTSDLPGNTKLIIEASKPNRSPWLRDDLDVPPPLSIPFPPRASSRRCYAEG